MSMRDVKLTDEKIKAVCKNVFEDCEKNAGIEGQSLWTTCDRFGLQGTEALLDFETGKIIELTNTLKDQGKTEAEIAEVIKEKVKTVIKYSLYILAKLECDGEAVVEEPKPQAEPTPAPAPQEEKAEEPKPQPQPTPAPQQAAPQPKPQPTPAPQQAAQPQQKPMGQPTPQAAPKAPAMGQPAGQPGAPVGGMNLNNGMPGMPAGMKPAQAPGQGM